LQAFAKNASTGKSAGKHKADADMQAVLDALAALNPEPMEKDPRIDLIHADLRGLPPVTLIKAQIDPLRSDGDLLADSLQKAGVKVEHKVYPGTTHEFFGMAAVVADARDAQAFAGRRLKDSFKQ
jgi:acetyl esterase